MGREPHVDLKTARQLRLVCHPELRAKDRNLGSAGEEDSLQGERKSKCLVNK